MIKEAYIDSNNIVKKDTILLFNSYNRTVEDAFVFDDVAAVKVPGFFFVFFKRPLSQATFTTTLNRTADSVAGDANITAWDFRPYKDGLQLFAVKKGTIYRYDFSIDMSATQVAINQIFVNYAKFDGILYTVNVTPKEVVIACGDCSVPGVFFFDEELKPFGGGDQRIDNPTARKLTLAVNFQDAVRKTEVIVGSQARADMITRQSDSNGNEIFSIQEKYYSGTSVSNTTNASVSVGMGPQYVVLKQKNDVNFKIASFCSVGSRYDNVTNSCQVCPTAQKSFGGQSTECFSCLEMRFKSRGDEIALGLYSQVCTDGQIKALIVFFAFPFILMTMSLICCITAEKNLEDNDDLLSTYGKRYRLKRGYTRKDMASTQGFKKARKDSE